MPQRLRCAVIGVGAAGLEHLDSLARCPRAVAVAIAETHSGRAKEASERFKIGRTYADYKEVLDQPDIEAVTIALPNFLHATVATAALQARKHVFVEMPLAMNAKEAQRMVEAARKARRILMAGLGLRFLSATQLARQAIERGDLGDIYYASCYWVRRSGIPRIGSWFTQKQCAGGGPVMNLGGSILDACLSLLGEFSVSAVSSHTCAQFGPRGVGNGSWGKSEIAPGLPFDVEDFGLAFLRLKSGRTLMLRTCWAANLPPECPEYGMDFLGTKAGLSLFPARLFRQGQTGYEAIWLTAPKLPHDEDPLHHFAASALDGKQPVATLDQALAIQQIIDAIYQSAKIGREVQLR